MKSVTIKDVLASLIYIANIEVLENKWEEENGYLLIKLDEDTEFSIQVDKPKEENIDLVSYIFRKLILFKCIVSNKIILHSENMNESLESISETYQLTFEENFLN